MTYPTLPNVSRETNDKLKHFANLLAKWNPRINLVSKRSLDELWERHIVDSVQIANFIEDPVDHWVDLGSGGGFPGLVVAILAKEHGFPKKVTLVESDARKCAFLRTVIRETESKASVINDRIERIQPLNADVLSARALADLDLLFGFCELHLVSNGTAVFPKGATWQQELKMAESKWKFEYRVVSSEIEPSAAILGFTGVSRV